MSLVGRGAVVTGGSRGIGRAVAEALAREGARVAVLSRNLEVAQRVAAELPSVAGGAHLGVVCEVTSEESRAAMVAALAEDGLTPSILVNNAGATRDGLLLRASERDVKEVLDVNLVGAMMVTKVLLRPLLRAAPALRDKGGVAVVNIGSVVGAHGNAGQSAYSAAKAGLVGFSKSMARELGSKGVRVNVVEPGWIESEMTADIQGDAARRSAIENATALSRLGATWEVAEAVKFLVSPHSAYITGQVLQVDGGLFI